MVVTATVVVAASILALSAMIALPFLHSAPPAAVAPQMVPVVERPADISAMNVAILGDLHRAQDVGAIATRLRVVHDPLTDASGRLDAIEVATDVDLGPTLDRFADIDELVDLARREGVKLFLRVKPHLKGSYAKAVCRETRIGQTERYLPSEQISFCDPTYVAAVEAYFRAIAKHYADEPVVVGFGIGICPSGET
ncbi:MAG TPA: hypothetical protein VHX44_19320 [Planctomycetota bacterium]|nr:hypothetical protein [Planctomycetota bacterium]